MATHVFSDIYTLPKPWRDKKKADQVWSSSLMFLTVLSVCIWTQVFAATLRSLRFPWLGSPSFRAFYSPLQLIDWVPKIVPLVNVPAVHRAVFVGAGELVSLIICAFLLARSARAYVLARSKLAPDTHGSARIATVKDIRKAGFFKNRGSYLGYVNTKDGPRYVRAEIEGHKLVIGPTGTGKTSAQLFYTLLTWRGNIFALDLGGEAWAKTAGFRASPEGMNSECLRLSLSDDTEGNACLNPLDLIRLGPVEYQDALDLVEVLIDPEGRPSARASATMSESFFQNMASSLLIATILYVKYKYPPERQTLAQVLEIFSDPKAANTAEILDRMRNEDHDPKGTRGWLDSYNQPTRKNKYIVGPATDTMLMTEDMRASMIATCKRYLKPYRNPLVAKATSRSSFDILDLVNPDKHISLYLIVAASSKDSLKPVTRLLINMIMKKLTERLPVSLDAERRLRVVIDEFAAQGALPAFAEWIQLARKFGIDCELYIQGQNQILELYGQYETITGACKNVVVFTPTDDDTCKHISERLGDFTLREKMESEGEKKSQNYRDSARRLLFPHEVRKLPKNRALVFVQGHPPMYLYKRFVHDDAEFSHRLSYKPPFDIADAAVLQDERAPDSASPYAVGVPPPELAA
jgi:type IV secretion system protein VirD4